MSTSMSGRPVACRRQEPLEEQLVADRVDVGDADRVADRGVGRRPAALAEDVVRLGRTGRCRAPPGSSPGNFSCRNDIQFTLDLRVGPGRARRRAVTAGRADDHQLAQPAVLGVPGGHVERRQLRGDELQVERALPPQFGCGGNGFGVLREQPGHLVTRAQVRPTRRRQPAGRLVEATAGRASHPSPSPAAPATARRSARRWWRRPDTEARRERGQRGVALVVLRVTVVGEFDADPVGAEPLHQVAPAPRAAASGPPSRKRWRTCPLRHPVRICQCPPAAAVRASKS